MFAAVLLLLFQVRFAIQDLAGGQGELRLEIGRIDLEKQIPFFHLLVIMDRNTNNWSGHTRGNADDIRPDLAIPCPGFSTY